MGWLLSVYIGAAVFGVGVTLVDLFGLIGSHEGAGGHDAGGHEGGIDHDIGGHEGGSDHDFGGHEGGVDHDIGGHEGGGDHDLGGHEGAGDHDFGAHEGDTAYEGTSGHEGLVDYVAAGHDGGEGGGHATEGPGGVLSGHEGLTESSTAESAAQPGALGHHGGSGRADHDGSLAGHDRPERRSLLLSLLTVLRNLIYFCLGFGPVGWFALATSGSVVTSLLWSVPVGGAALVGTRTLRRFMRRELNSAVSTSEVLMEHGVVTVSIAPGELGKVRIKLGDLYVERFARAASAQASIRVGASVRVTDVTDDCVYVEEE